MVTPIVTRADERSDKKLLSAEAAVVTSGSRVMRNTGLTLASIGVPLVSAFFFMPELTRNLGAARFGLLGLTWALLEYFSLFDVGLGRGTTKFVAERIAARSADLPQIIIVSMTSQLAMGAVAGVLLAFLSPVIVGHWLVVPADMIAEARTAFALLALMLPFVLLSLGLRGVLEAAQRFDLSAAIRTPSSAATFLIPAVLAPYGVRLPGILLGLLGARILTCGALVFAVHRALPSVKWKLPTEWRLPRALMSFSGWIAVSNVVSPILVYLDRFVLGAVIGLGAVGFYTPAYELTARMMIIPGSLLTAMFPMVSAASNGDGRERARLGRIFALSVRNLLLLLAPAVVLLCVFAPEILRLWLGPEFAAQSALALRILAVGVMIVSLSHVPCGYLQASGRPDVPARFHLLELAIHLPLTWFLVRNWGITGAAMAWTTRVTIDAVLLFTGSDRVLGMSATHALRFKGKHVVVTLSALVAATLLVSSVRVHLALTLALMGIILAAFVYLVWRMVLSADERAAINRAVVLRRADSERSTRSAVAH